MLSAFALCVLAAALAAAQNVTEYDYVIVGAGTAGMLLAIVLSENPDITVCVLEAGGDGRTDLNITVPERRGELSSSVPLDLDAERYRHDPRYHVRLAVHKHAPIRPLSQRH